ncbi:MqnA/MqnD/SBP family protein [Microbacterium sp. ARD31]|uniref:ABC transporter substrate-binding protein n=1 Tax=Microbacterium sp. ARD31 TaxID=2962576 RepID=UPI0028823D02|nr:ABC transporter substrate-binding protein [Microbacterium sp. ARD31]MDT0183947.1 MqnA/MqnD/SBP family protein [Microbacterium sp. ARD31]
MLDDDSQRSAFYAIENGLVESDIVPGIEVNYLQIPALIQASGTDQFNYTQTSLNGVVLARENGGLDLRVVAYALAHSGGGLAIYTREDSDISSPADLTGHTLATPSFGSTGTLEAQLVLADKYDLDAALEGGAVSWVELDPPTTLNALKSGDIDAALMWHQGGWNASNDPELTKIAAIDQDFKEIANGAWPIGVAVVANGEFVDANLECVNEFQRMYAESVAYAEENHADFAEEISATSGVPVEFIDYWWDDSHYMYGGVVDDEWLGYADEFYKLAADQGFIPVYPDVDEITVIPGN